jgi:hypothetical protein
MQTTLTRSEVQSVLGELEGDVLDRILAMGITRADLAEVARQIELYAGDDEMLDEGTIEELCQLVRDEERDEIWAEDAGSPGARD